MKQAERIHHRCRCLDRNFTFEEWSEYLRENPSGGSVLTFGAFQFNICDVCLTPNHPVRIERNVCELDIETAQSVNGRWSYGIHLGLHSEFSSHGAQFVDDHSRGYPTEKEAIYDALLYSGERTKKKIKELEQTTEAIERLGRNLESLNRPSRHDRRFPPYRKKLNPRGHVRPIFWHRIRSNPHRRRKPH